MGLMMYRPWGVPGTASLPPCLDGASASASAIFSSDREGRHSHVHLDLDQVRQVPVTDSRTNDAPLTPSPGWHPPSHPAPRRPTGGTTTNYQTTTSDSLTAAVRWGLPLRMVYVVDRRGFEFACCKSVFQGFQDI